MRLEDLIEENRKIDHRGRKEVVYILREALAEFVAPPEEIAIFRRAVQRAIDIMERRIEFDRKDHDTIFKRRKPKEEEESQMITPNSISENRQKTVNLLHEAYCKCYCARVDVSPAESTEFRWAVIEAKSIAFGRDDGSEEVDIENWYKNMYVRAEIEDNIFELAIVHYELLAEGRLRWKDVFKNPICVKWRTDGVGKMLGPCGSCSLPECTDGACTITSNKLLRFAEDDIGHEGRTVSIDQGYGSNRIYDRGHLLSPKGKAAKYIKRKVLPPLKTASAEFGT